MQTDVKIKKVRDGRHDQTRTKQAKRRSVERKQQRQRKARYHR